MKLRQKCCIKIILQLFLLYYFSHDLIIGGKTWKRKRLPSFDQAPKICAKTSKKGVPVIALCVSMAFALIGILSEFFAADTVYLVIIWYIGGANIFMYSVICICQYRFRKRYIAEGGKVEDLPYRVPAYPLVPIAGVVAFGIMLIVTIMDPGERVAMAFCAVCYIVTYVIAHFYTKKHDVKAANLDL